MKKKLILLGMLFLLNFILLSSSVYGEITDNVTACWSFDVDTRDDYGGVYDGINAGADHNTTNSKVGGGAYKLIRANTDWIDMNLTSCPSSWTLSGWYNFTDTSGMSTLMNKNGLSGFSIWQHDTRGWSIRGGTGYAFTMVGSYTQNTWKHVLVTYNGGDNNWTMYVDSVMVGSGFDTTTCSTGQWRLGSMSYGGDYMDGYVDEVKIWDGVLSQTDINADYNSGNGVPCSGLTPSLDTINISIPSPTDSTQWNVTTLNINATTNASYNFNATLRINETINQTKLDIGAGTDVIVSWNITFSDGIYNYSIEVYDNGTGENTTTNIFYVDTTSPTIDDTSLDGNDTYWSTRLDLNINLSDNLNIYSLMINDTCGYSYHNVSMNVSSFEYLNQSMNITSCGVGEQQTNITICDGWVGDLNCISSSYNWYAMARLNITAYDLIAVAVISNFDIYVDGVLDGSTTGGYYHLDNLTIGDHNVTIDSLGYELKSEVVTIASAYQHHNFSLHTTNSIQIYIKDETTNSYILDNVSIRFTGNSTEFINYTTSGNFYIDNLTAEEYQIWFDVNDTYYSSRTYTLTVSERSHQILNVFLSKNTSITTFTISDKDTAEWLEDVLVTMYRFINGSWQAVESKYTDITGKSQLSYMDDVQYRFFLGKSGYDDYIFYLNPVLYSDYDIQMEKDAIYNLSQDLDKIAIIYAPHSFSTGINNFNWIIQSPYGELINYGYTITYPGGSNTTSGVNAIGGQLGMVINITGATIWDNVILEYYYTTSLAGTRNFTVLLPIDNVDVGNNTLIKNKDETYGLGLFERVLIATIILIFVVGISALVGQTAPGMALGLAVMGLLIYAGFVPFWSFGISMVLGVFFLFWGNR